MNKETSREVHVNKEDILFEKREYERRELQEEFRARELGVKFTSSERCPYDSLCDSAGCRWDAERKVFTCGKVKK